MTTSIPIGPATEITQNVVYALPSRAIFLTSIDEVETSLNGTDWTTQPDSVTGVIVGSVFVRCTTGDTTIVCAAATFSESGGGGDNPFDQDLNTDDTPQFAGVGIGTAGDVNRLTIRNSEPRVWIESDDFLSQTIISPQFIAVSRIAGSDAATTRIDGIRTETIEATTNNLALSTPVGSLGILALTSDYGVQITSGNDGDIELTPNGVGKVSVAGLIQTTGIMRDSGDLTLSTTTSGNINLTPADGAVEVTGSISATEYLVGATPGIDASITTGDLVGKTITVEKGIITGFA